MNSTAIEMAACTKIVDLANQYPYHLSPEIPTNDKSPSFDEEIVIYSDSNRKKENIVGSVAVQVKGTTVEKGYNKYKDVYKYDISNSDMAV